MLICIKQQLSIIWSSVNEKLNNTEAELKKKVTLNKAWTYLVGIHPIINNSWFRSAVFVFFCDRISYKKFKPVV